MATIPSLPQGAIDDGGRRRREAVPQTAPPMVGKAKRDGRRAHAGATRRSKRHESGGLLRMAPDPHDERAKR